MFRPCLLRAILLAALCVSPVQVFAQETDTEPNPIKWSIKANASEPIKAGDQFVLELTAQIENGWHLYSTERIEGGPTPTRITLAPGQEFEIAGD